LRKWLCVGDLQFAYVYHLQHGFGTPSDSVKSYTYYEVARTRRA